LIDGSYVEVTKYTTGQKTTYVNTDITQVEEFRWNIDNTVEDEHIYGYTISTQNELNKIKDDKTGAYLGSLFKQYNKIKIITSDNNWIGDFYLPQSRLVNQLITFECKSTYGFNVYKLINGSYLKVNFTNGKKATFINKNPLNNIWLTLNDYNLSEIGYMDGLLACILPYTCITPGMKLEFRYQDQKSTLSDIKVGGFSELILNTIDIGMLTPNRNQMAVQKNRELQRQYFQTVPVSRLIFNEYAPIHLTEVMLPNGTLLNTCDPSKGGIYDGAMREYIGKILISLGINKANLGINDSSGATQSYTYFTPLMTVHNSVGKYCQDGIVVHGLSGGGGMITLYDTIGNEFSHEVGHSYGLGHYPNGANGSIHRPDGDINSTWGWDADLNKFIPNFLKTINNKESCLDDGKSISFDVKSINSDGDVKTIQCGCGCVDNNEEILAQNESRIQVCIPPFEGHQFNFDAMAGGGPQYSNYTLHTPYVLSTIQKFLDSKAMFDRKSATGFSKWNATTKTMEPIDQIVNGAVRKPVQQGVPVVTLLGYIDPTKKTAYIYPLLAGAYGMIYQSSTTRPNGNYVEVEYNYEGKKYLSYYPLSATNFSSGFSNMFHINLERKAHILSYLVRIVINNDIIQGKFAEVPADDLKYYVHGKPLEA
jgi:hypothetical protein